MFLFRIASLAKMFIFSISDLPAASSAFLSHSDCGRRGEGEEQGRRA